MYDFDTQKNKQNRIEQNRELRNRPVNIRTWYIIEMTSQITEKGWTIQ